MASWITIYLQAPLENLKTSAIEDGISPADWWTLGEDFEIDEDDVEDFMDSIIWEDDPLQFRIEGKRPVRIHIWNDAGRIKEEIGEVGGAPASVKQHLKNVKTIIAIELGHSQLRTMHEIVAFEIAYWIAETNLGLIKGHNEMWYDYDEHRWNPIE